MTTRRDFLSKAPLAFAGTALGARALRAGTPVGVSPDFPDPANAFLPATLAPLDMRGLAARATEAARAAGAVYADIRVSHRHRLDGGLTFLNLQSEFNYGVRALVDGVWGFAYGRDPSADAIVRCAQNAVATAKLSSVLTKKMGVDLWEAPPVVHGEYRMPIQVDPFAIPMRQHAEMGASLSWTMRQVPGVSGEIRMTWSKETRVIAATTGTCVTIDGHLTETDPWAMALYGNNDIELVIPGLRSGPVGYELLLAPDLQDRVKAAAVEAAELSKLPMRPMDVGRYPVVFDGNTMAGLVGRVIGPSAQLDRVLSHNTDTSESSRWTLDLLGTRIASPLVTVTGHRNFPEAVNAAPWDDEGSVPRAHTTIKDGVLIDYHTTGQTVSALQQWYAGRKQPARSNGCAVAVTPATIVGTRPPHVTMVEGTHTSSLDDLCREMGRGVLAMRTTRVRTDQQLSSGMLHSSDQLFEIVGGKIVSRLKGNGLQFSTLPFLNGLLALGDRTTVRTTESNLFQGVPWVASRQSASAPAGLFKDIAVISL